jgi:hypothetical protein
MHDQTFQANLTQNTSALLKYLQSALVLGSLTSEELFQFLGYEDADLRVEALNAARSLGPSFAALAGRAGICDIAPLVRMRSAELLGEFGTKELDSHRLAAALVDQSWIVRSSTALALGCLGGTEAFNALAGRLEVDPNEAVRRDIAHAIAEFGKDSIPFIENALRSEKSRIARCGLLNGYYNVAGDGLAHLLALLTDTDVMVRSNAINCWVWDEIRPQDKQKVVAALTMLVGTDENPANVMDAKNRLAEFNASQQVQAQPKPSVDSAPDAIEAVGEDDIVEQAEPIDQAA